MKNTTEWLQSFNLLWNNIASDKAPGLEPYEISVFLTQAQEAVVKDYFSAKSNGLSEGFDNSARRQSDFKNLIVTETLTTASSGDVSGFTMNAQRKYYKCPAKALVLLNEELITTAGSSVTVLPISYDEYSRLMMQPYKYPPKGQVWRLIMNTGQQSSGAAFTDASAYQVFELIGNFANIGECTYRLRYVKRPSPIILESLASTGLSINGETAETTCQLPEHLHDEILQRAVLGAKVSWVDQKA